MKKHTPPRPVSLMVEKNSELTPNMRRIVLTGEALLDYPEITTSAYVKLLFDLQGKPLSAPPTSKDDILMRTYTIRDLDRQNKTMSIDMALHGNSCEDGPASHWAKHAQPGEHILIGGPGKTKPLGENYDWVLFAGDMTSLPAISAYLERLPKHTQGYAVIKITSEDDKQALTKPDNVALVWVVDDEEKLADAVAQLPWPDGTPAIWAACEFSAMRELRTLFREQRQVAHSQIYISSYWRQGRSEDQHKIDKRIDAEAFASMQ